MKKQSFGQLNISLNSDGSLNLKFESEDDMNFFSKLLQAWPAILQGVVTIENTINAPGATKKEIIMSGIQTAAQVTEQLPNPVLQGFGAMIDSLVAVLNKNKVAPFGQPAVTPPAA